MERNKQDIHKSKCNENKNKPKNNGNKFRPNSYKHITPEELENLCSRLLTLHKTGVYIPPPSKPRICKNKKKNSHGPREYTSDIKERKTTFGKGRVGVSCESYGIKNCSCCEPLNPYFPHTFNHSENMNLNLFFNNDNVYSSENEHNRIENDIICIDESSSDSSIASILSTMNHQNRIEDIIILDEDSNDTIINDEMENIKIDTSNTNKNDMCNFIPTTNIKKELVSSSTNIEPNKSSEDFTVIKEECNHISEEKSLIYSSINRINDPKNQENEGNEDIMDFVKSITQDIDVDEELNKMMEFEKNFLEMIKNPPKNNENLTAIDHNLTSVPDIRLEENVSNVQNCVTINNNDSNANEMILKPSTSKDSPENNLIVLNKQQKTVKKKQFDEVICLDASPQLIDVIKINDSIEKSEIPKSQPQLNKTPPSQNNFRLLNCPICLDSFEDKEIMSTICGHLFCSVCIKNVIRKTKKCPNCRKALTLKSIHPIYI